MASAGVRPATEEDMPAIVGIYIRAYGQPPWNERHDPVSSEGYLRWVMDTPGTRCLVATEARAVGEGSGTGGTGGAVTGFILAGPREYEQFVQDWERLAEQPAAGWPAIPGRLGYIWEIAVEPVAQRRGHGTSLLGAAIEMLRQQGVDTVVLRSSERAAAAIGLYRRFGFRRLPVQERLDPLSGPWILPLAAGSAAGSAADSAGPPAA
ncbi:MAG: GNAT family N-acetyltransferase [Chloroflexota bacterium]